MTSVSNDKAASPEAAPADRRSWTKRHSWAELERQGIKRCCVMFSSGKRCRRRASEDFGSSWCDKHGPEMKMHTDWANAVIRAEAGSKQEDEALSVGSEP
jgi:hypothetical protein